MSGANQKTILLVENEDLVPMSLGKDLEKCGYVVIRANSGEQAIEMAGKTPSIDIILMDIDLGSGIDGAEAAAQIHKYKDIPLVFMFSHTNPELVEKTEKITSYGYVEKKSGIVVLKASIKMALKLFDAKTKERVQEEALRESYDRFEAIFESLDEAVFLIDSSTRKIIECNDATTIIFGFSRDELTSQKTNIIHVDHDHFEQFGQAALMAYENPGYYKTEFEMKRKDGTIFPSENFVRPLRDNEGRTSYVVSRVRDITERKQAEEALKINEKRFRELFEGTPAISVQGYDRNRRLIFWNKASEVLYGYSAGNALGKRLEDLIIPEWMRDDVIRLHQNWLEEGEPIPASELRLKRADGSLVPVFSSHVLLWNAKGEPEMYCIDIDLTDQKKAEAAIEKSLKEKDILLSEIHHRVKNNMAIISSMLTLQSEFEDKKKEPEALLQDLQTRIMSMSWVHELVYENNNFVEISASKLLERLANYLKSGFQPEGKQISMHVRSENITLDMNNSVPLTLLIAEVLTNTWKHAFTGRQRGRIEVILEKQDNGFHLVAQDDGVGVSDIEQLNKPESFGYTIIHGLAQQLQGKLDFSSPPDGGLKIEMWFPERMAS